MPKEIITKERLTEAFRERRLALVQMLRAKLREMDKEQDSMAVAEELIQEAFLRAWRFREQYDGRREASVETWIRKIALNVLLDYRRKQKARGLGKHVSLETLFEGEVSAEDIPSLSAESTQESDVRYRSLMREVEWVFSRKRCPSYYRFIFALRAIEDYQVDEISAATGIPSNTVKVALWRSRLMLQKALAQ